MISRPDREDQRTRPDPARPSTRVSVDRYLGLHDGSEQGDAAARRSRYDELVTDYYDLVTDFYEFGWGQSFHFAPRRRDETLAESLTREERYLAERLALGPDHLALDVGCGVGGPMREIARHSGAGIVGINTNAYQLRRAARHNRRAGLADRCALLRGDFMRIPMADEQLDAAYSIEATVHAPDKTQVFAEVHRVLRPGASFAGYEWCLTSGYDREDPEHRAIKQGIEEGSGLPDIASIPDIPRALEAAGFDVVEARDQAPDGDPETPWYLALEGRDASLRSLPRTPLGRALTYGAVRALEAVRLLPDGVSEVSRFLNRGADLLVAGGRRGVFTPLVFFLARKR